MAQLQPYHQQVLPKPEALTNVYEGLQVISLVVSSMNNGTFDRL